MPNEKILAPPAEKSRDNSRSAGPREEPFVAPDVEEVVRYCEERKSSVDARRFVDYYASVGWMVGRNPMRDWKAALRRWESADPVGGSGSGSGASGGASGGGFAYGMPSGGSAGGGFVYVVPSGGSVAGGALGGSPSGGGFAGCGSSGGSFTGGCASYQRKDHGKINPALDYPQRVYDDDEFRSGDYMREAEEFMKKAAGGTVK